MIEPRSMFQHTKKTMCIMVASIVSAPVIAETQLNTGAACFWSQTESRRALICSTDGVTNHRVFPASMYFEDLENEPETEPTVVDPVQKAKPEYDVVQVPIELPIEVEPAPVAKSSMWRREPGSVPSVEEFKHAMAVHRRPPYASEMDDFDESVLMLAEESENGDGFGDSILMLADEPQIYVEDLFAEIEDLADHNDGLLVSADEPKHAGGNAQFEATSYLVLAVGDHHDVIEKLEDAADEDFIRLRKPPFANRVSLGAFSKLTNARKRSAMAAEYDIDVEFVDRVTGIVAYSSYASDTLVSASGRTNLKKRSAMAAEFDVGIEAIEQSTDDVAYSDYELNASGISSAPLPAVAMSYLVLAVGDLHEVLEKLEFAADEDFIKLNKPPLANRVSLGIFSTLENAWKRSEMAVEYEINVEFIDRATDVVVYSSYEANILSISAASPR